MADDELVAVSKKKNPMVKFLIIGIFFLVVLIILALIAFMLINKPKEEIVKVNDDLIQNVSNFMLNEFRVNLYDESMLKFQMVLELNRDDKGEKLELVKMKLRDIVNLYFIKVTKNDARLNIDTHKEKLKEMFNQFFDKQESLKVSKPLFFGQAIPLRVRNIYFTEYLIIND